MVELRDAGALLHELGQVQGQVLGSGPDGRLVEELARVHERLAEQLEPAPRLAVERVVLGQLTEQEPGGDALTEVVAQGREVVWTLLARARLLWDGNVGHGYTSETQLMRWWQCRWLAV